MVDRFAQIEPKVLLAVDGYRYGGRDFDRSAIVAELEASLPTLSRTVRLPYLGSDGDWAHAFAPTDEPLSFERVPFDHPLWIVYSSGTTGLPKAIVHGHGGILLEHLKNFRLHHDVRAGDRIQWFTTTGWIMWNYLVSGLLTDVSVVLYDGNPGYPDRRPRGATCVRRGGAVIERSEAVDVVRAAAVLNAGVSDVGVPPNLRVARRLDPGTDHVASERRGGNAPGGAGSCGRRRDERPEGRVPWVLGHRSHRPCSRQSSSAGAWSRRLLAGLLSDGKSRRHGKEQQDPRCHPTRAAAHPRHALLGDPLSRKGGRAAAGE